MCPECDAALEDESTGSGLDGEPVTCPSCGKTVRPEAVVERGSSVDVCPKCGAKRTARADCVRCGLLFDRFDPAALEPTKDPVLDPAWESLLADYGDVKRHDAFLEVAREHGKLDGAAARYRARLLKQKPDPEAERRLAEIRVLTLAKTLPPSRPRKGKSRSKRAWIWMLVVLAVAAVAIYIIMSYGGGGGRARQSTSDGPGAEPVNLKK